MNGFASLAAQLGVTVAEDPTQENTFLISGTPTAPPTNTGFFLALADQGIQTIAINNAPFTIADEDGELTAGAGAARDAIIASLAAGNQTFNVTVDLPYGDGTTTTPVTYTFNYQP